MSLLLRYASWMVDEKGWSRQTRRTRTDTIRAFERWLRREHRIGLLQAGRSEVLTFITRRPHPRTRNKYLGDLRAFYRFCVATGLRKVDPTSGLVRVRAPRLLPRELERSEAARLFLAADACSERAGTVVCLLLHAGLRREEAARLSWAEVEFTAHRLRIMGKGSRERVIPMHPVLQARLRWWRERVEGTFVFPSEPHPDRPMSVVTIWADVKVAAELAGIPNVTPHRCRHTFATELLRAGSDIRRVQELLGHAALTSTQIYTGVSIAHLEADVGRLDFAPARGKNASTEEEAP